MNKTILRNGLLSVLTLTVTGLINYLLSTKLTNYHQSEAAGYITIILSLAFVYFGIRQFRDRECGGAITYWRAFGVGMLIVLFPSVAFGIFDVIYVKFMDPGFMEKYYTTYIAKMKMTLPPEQFQVKLKQIQSEKELFSNIYMQFFLMAITVFLIGIVVSAIAALILHRKPKVRAV